MTTSDNIKKLRASISSGRVQLTVADDDLARFTQTRDLANLSGGDTTVTLVVNDFYQDGVVYHVSGLVLADDGSTIERYWPPTESGAGIQCELSVSDAKADEAFVISAQPADPKALRPASFDSRKPAEIGRLPDTGSGSGGGAGTGSGSGGATGGN